MAENNSKGPTGHERMRRRRPANASFHMKLKDDVKAAYDLEQLSEIGAIALAWNQIEGMIEWLVTVAFISAFYIDLAIEVTAKIKGVGSQIELLRVISQKSNMLQDDGRLIIKDTLDAVCEYKDYRNGIIHSHVFDHEQGIGQYTDAFRRSWQILLTKDALNMFYIRLDFLKEELREVDIAYRMITDGKRFTVLNPDTNLPVLDQSRALLEQAIPEQLKKVADLQIKRKSLPQLPKFPDAPLTVPKMEDTEIRPGSGGTQLQ